MRFSPVSSCKRLAAGVCKPAVTLTLVALVLFPVGLAAQGLPVQNGPMLPVAIWWVGACVLGLVLAYGIFRNRSRTRAEKQLTEQATKNLYAEEERDRVL
jgi:phosphate/sulfate permease